jgi:carboxylesterase
MIVAKQMAAAERAGRADASPFDLDRGGERGVLLLHGFTGTPFEVRPLGEALAARGITAVGPTLPGHGATPAALNATRWTDWLSGALAELAALRRRCARVAVCGLSLGGLLALELARRTPELRAVASLGAPLWLPATITTAVRALRFVTRARLLGIPKSGGSDIRDPVVKAGFPTMRELPLAALESLIDFQPRVRARLHEIKTPLLVIHADQDHVAPPACAPELMRRVASRDRRLVTLPESFHIVTVDVERERVAREVGDFISERL